MSIRKKSLPRIRLRHKERLKTIFPKSLKKLLCARDSFKQKNVPMEGNRKRVCSLTQSSILLQHVFAQMEFACARGDADWATAELAHFPPSWHVLGALLSCSCTALN